MKKNILLIYLIFNALYSLAQDQNPLVLNEDAKYFDFWEGTWYLIKEDNSLDSLTYFKVKKSIHPAAFTEEWQFGKQAKSIALRAWDKINQKWGFVWVSDNGLYQVWDSKKVEGNWYIYKEFDINGDKYLSRQGFILNSDGTVTRISEKTYDGKKWELRFKQKLKKLR